MKKYKKPDCINSRNGRGLIPVALAGGAAAMSVTQAALVGAAAGLAALKGGRDIRMNHQSLLKHAMS